MYVTGGSDGYLLVGLGADLYNYFATIKYDPEGQQLWVARYQDGGYAHAIALDKNSNVCVTGGYSDRLGDRPSVTIKYDGQGKEMWAATFPGHEPWDMALDEDSNLYVTERDLFGQIEYTTVKYDPQGGKDWVVTYDGPGQTHYDHAVTIALDNIGNVYVTGGSVGTGKGTDYATIKYSPVVQGAEVKNQVNQAALTKGDNLSWDITIDGIGRVDIYLAIVFPSGIFVCLRDIQGTTGDYNIPLPIVQNWSIIPGTYRIISYMFNGNEPKGEYWLYIILTKPRANPLARNKWIVYGSSNFTFQ